MSVYLCMSVCSLCACVCLSAFVCVHVHTRVCVTV